MSELQLEIKPVNPYGDYKIRPKGVAWFTEKQAKEIRHQHNCHDELVAVSHNLAKTMGIDYAIKKLSTIPDDNFALGAATILKGIQNQAKAALDKVNKQNEAKK